MFSQFIGILIYFKLIPNTITIMLECQQHWVEGFSPLVAPLGAPLNTRRIHVLMRTTQSIKTFSFGFLLRNFSQKLNFKHDILS